MESNGVFFTTDNIPVKLHASSLGFGGEEEEGNESQ
jgi:hypothetical protein